MATHPHRRTTLIAWTLLACMAAILFHAAPPARAQDDPPAAPPNGAIESMELIYATDSSEYYRLTYWSDGLRIRGFIGWPKAEGRYPAIIYNRGGAWDTGRLAGREIVPFVECGYVAVASQYRGNGGSEGTEQFGWGEVNDVLALIPLLQNLPNVDPGRIGMMGGSRGGMVTYMALKHEGINWQRNIKAAVTIGGIADLFAWAEEQPRVVEDLYLPLIGRRPAEAWDWYEMRSAVHWPTLINAPLLIMHGEADDQVSVEQSRRLYRALKAANKPVTLLTIPGGDHALSGQSGGYAEALRFFNRLIGADGRDHAYETHVDQIGRALEWFAQHPQ